MRPFGIVSDIHFHSWNAFSNTLPTGINDRLQFLIDEFARACKTVRDAGGNTVFITGDVFHVRGSIAPTVLNPVQDMLRVEVELNGMVIHILPGNHDLEGKESNRIGSAVQCLSDSGCIVYNYPTTVRADMARDDSPNALMIPWIENLETLKATIKEKYHGELFVMIHAPIDGVLPGLPPHGLNAEWLAATCDGATVFSGHYHHHKSLGHSVFSVGALAHQTWSDVGSDAGFLIVTHDETVHDHPMIHHYPSHAPKFLDFAELDIETYEGQVKDNYVRVRMASSDMKHLKSARDDLMKAGARGVILQAVREPSKGREGSTVTKGAASGVTLGESVSSFIKSAGFTNPDAVQSEAANILTAVSMAPGA